MVSAVPVVIVIMLAISNVGETAPAALAIIRGGRRRRPPPPPRSRPRPAPPQTLPTKALCSMQIFIDVQSQGKMVVGGGVVTYKTNSFFN